MMSSWTGKDLSCYIIQTKQLTKHNYTSPVKAKQDTERNKEKLMLN